MTPTETILIGGGIALWALTLYIAYLYGQMTVYAENIRKNVESIQDNLAGERP